MIKYLSYMLSYTTRSVVCVAYTKCALVGALAQRNLPLRECDTAAVSWVVPRSQETPFAQRGASHSRSVAQPCTDGLPVDC